MITSGGVGPTHDDITIYSVARALNQAVRENNVCVLMLLSRGSLGCQTSRRLPYNGVQQFENAYPHALLERR